MFFSHTKLALGEHVFFFFGVRSENVFPFQHTNSTRPLKLCALHNKAPSLFTIYIVCMEYTGILYTYIGEKYGAKYHYFCIRSTSNNGILTFRVIKAFVVYKTLLWIIQPSFIKLNNSKKKKKKIREEKKNYTKAQTACQDLQFGT